MRQLSRIFYYKNECFKEHVSENIDGPIGSMKKSFALARGAERINETDRKHSVCYQLSHLVMYKKI